MTDTQRRRGKDAGFVLVFADDTFTPPNLGEGISRTSNPRARLWKVKVSFADALPMSTTVLATSQKEAVRFTKNRYPASTSIICTGKA
jgi:hypothetical protein